MKFRIFLIFRIISSFFFLNSDVKINRKEGFKSKLNDFTYELSKNCISKIDSFISDYFKYVIEAVGKLAKEKVEEYSEELSKEIIEYQHEFNISNNNLLEFKTSKNKLKEQLKLYIHNNTYDKILFLGNKNAVKHLINPLINLFGKIFHDLYEFGMKQKDFIEKAKKSIEFYFTKLEKEIQEYKNKKKKESNVPNGNNPGQKTGNTNNSIQEGVSSLFS